MVGRVKISGGRHVLARVLAGPGVVWALLRITGWSPGPVVVALPFTPYVAVLSLIPLVVALVLRSRAAVVAGVVATVALVWCVVPRALPDGDRGPRDGVALRVLSANMLAGGADPATIVEQVRDRDVGVLALQEFTAGAQSALAAAGLGGLLPYSSIAPQRAADPFGTTGSAVYSRYPLTGTGIRLNEGGFQQAYGVVQPPGGTAVLVESAHPAATLIARGYRDVAATLGDGLTPSWGPYGDKPIPPITIDHVLADRRLGVTGYATHALPRSDHHLIFTALIVPPA
jgi:endonuclease/exonuclease/phosphatase family protein